MSGEAMDLSNFPEDWIRFVESFEGETKDALARMLRDIFLSGSDLRMVPDAPWDRDAWAAYRQALRDLPTHPEWPDMQFPSPPGGE